MSGYPIVLLHGLGVDHRMWGLQQAGLQKQGHVLSPDLPGFGRQPPLPPGDRHPAAYADWLAAWLAGRGTGPVTVVGYSMGGSLALLLARRHPGVVRRLVLCCSSPCWGRGPRGALARAFAGAGGRAAMELFQGSVLWGCRRWLPADRHGEVRDMVRRAHRPTMARLYLALAALDLVPQLPGVEIPALVIGGRRDWLAPPTHLRILARALPRARLELVGGAGHLLCLSHPARLSELLAQALAADRGPAP